MCYGSMHRSYNDDVNNNKVWSRVSISGDVRIEFNPSPTILLWKPEQGRSKAEHRQFQIESMRIELSNMLDEKVLTQLEYFKENPDKVMELLGDHFKFTGRWGLKSGGWAQKNEDIKINIAALPQQTMQVIHACVGKLFDTNLAEANRMYQAYSDIINLSLQNFEAIER